MKIRVFEAFAGYGSQSLALERLKRDFPNFDYEVVGISEIDKYAIDAYNALHPGVTNYGDISKINWEEVPDFDLFTYSSPCLNCCEGGGLEPKIQSHYRIRKLTPRECFRLMDVDDADIDKIQAAGISNSQQYKLAGNSIVVNVLYHLFRKMFVETENESQQLTLF